MGNRRPDEVIPRAEIKPPERLFPDPTRESLEQLLESGVEYERVSEKVQQRLQKEEQERREASINRAGRTIIVLDSISAVLPKTSRLTQNIKRLIMKRKSKELFDRYMQAEGMNKYIFGIGALLAFVAAAIQPEWVPFIVAGVFGAEAALKNYQDSLGEDE